MAAMAVSGGNLRTGRFRLSRVGLFGLLSLCLGVLPAQAQQPGQHRQTGRHNREPAPAAVDLTRQPTLYLVGYAHLDTQWRWEYPQVIAEFLPKTLERNFALFGKYPHYVFNFTGANRYRMIQEYYPRQFEELKRFVAAGRWFPAGSSMEENDVNVPSAESILRQILYGNEYFREQFGVVSVEYMLPDCFGFPASLPSLLAHAGLQGFSTQKLTWGSAADVGGPGSVEDTPRGIPFNVGLWVGPDGRGIIAALNPGDYSGEISEDLRISPEWQKRLQRDGAASGLFADYHYYGTGDTGGAPTEASVQWVERMLSTPAPPGALRVVSATAAQMFLDAARFRSQAHFPTYRGDLLLTNHSAGSLTSQAYHKRWNRENEVLADAAERISVAAAWLGGLRYPRQRLRRAWTLLLGGQFHDIMAGTATPRAYEFSWNDDLLAMNQFAGVLTDAVQAVAAALDTRARGIPVVVYNPLEIAREDVVELALPASDTGVAGVEVFGPDGHAVPAQLERTENGHLRLLFLAKIPPVGLAVFDVRLLKTVAPERAAELRVSETELENRRYRIRLDQAGDVVSVYDRRLGRELLAGPLRLAFQTEVPHDWPAWNMDWDDQSRPPRAYLGPPARIRVVERGPVRVAVAVERSGQGSRITQTIRLAAGDAGNRVEFANSVDWHTPAAALKATFPLAASNPLATYNWEVGTVERGNNDPKKFEVPSHQWLDLTDRSGRFGVTVLSDCKYGSDKPDDHTLRLTLLYTPGIGSGNGRFYADQASQDWGHHEFMYGLAAHAGDWRGADTVWQAYRLNVPLIAFRTQRHAGRLGRQFSFVQTDRPAVRLLALKQAERSEEVIVRVVEMTGRPQQRVHIRFAAPVVSAREVDGQEFARGPARVEGGQLVFTLTPYQLRSFAVRLGVPPVRLRPPRWQPVPLPFDRAVATADGEAAAPGFDASGRSLPAEMLPEQVPFAGVGFRLAPAGAGHPNAVVPHGQSIPLPAGSYNHLYILAAADAQDHAATFDLGGRTQKLWVESWGGFIGQWDRRQFVPRQIRDARGRPHEVLEFTGTITPGYIKPARVAWFASHHHRADGSNEPYAYSYLFGYRLDLPVGVHTLGLPDDPHLRILAVTVAEDAPAVVPLTPLGDLPLQVEQP